jgi:hypothetical protein
MQFVFFALVLTITACGNATSPTPAETPTQKTLAAPAVPGANAPAFQEALQTWLDGNDLAALDTFAALARQDNRAAQIFLARVAEDTDLHAHATSYLPRRERIALLRRPGGLSGRSWLSIAAPEVLLAKAFKDANLSASRPEGARALLSLGENAAAARLLTPMILNGQASEVLDILETADDPPPSVSALRIIAQNWARSPFSRYTGSARPPALLNSDITEYGFSVPELLTSRLIWVGELLYEPKTRTDAIGYAANVQSWAPLRTMCEGHCPPSVASCTAVGASTLRRAPLMPFASPVENLLPNARYWSSPRMASDVLRRLMDMRGGSDYFAYIDKCFAPMFGRLQQKAL